MTAKTKLRRNRASIVKQPLDQGPHRRWLDTGAAAFYLGSTPGTLKTWRAQGRGPRAHGTHRFVRYHVADLDAFMRGEKRP
jgi:hypothetical protein